MDYAQAIADLEALEHPTIDGIRNILSQLSVANIGEPQPTVTYLYSGSGDPNIYTPFPRDTAAAIASSDLTIGTINNTELARVLDSEPLKEALKRACEGVWDQPIEGVKYYLYASARDAFPPAGLPNNMPWPTSGLWEDASARFVSQVSGDVVTFTPQGSQARTFRAVELQGLIDNPNVTAINGIGMDVIRAELANGSTIDDIFRAVNAKSFELWHGAETYKTLDAKTAYVGGLHDVFAKVGIDVPNLEGTPSGHLFYLDQNITRSHLLDMIEGSKLLNKMGVAGDFLAALVAAAIIQERLDVGDVGGAGDALTDFLASEAGSILGAVAGQAVIRVLLTLIVGSAAVAGGGLIVTGLMVAGMIVGSIVGDEYGQLLKDGIVALIEHPEYAEIAFPVAMKVLVPDWLESLGAFFFPPISPLVLDLDGDGVELVDMDGSVAFFDLDEDGFAEKAGWVGADDGFLAHDLNANGRIDDLSELFGGQDGDGFSKLAVHDLNGDGKINASDAVYDELVLWKDTDGDGVTDAGELVSLEGAGIAEIGLNAQYVDQWVGDNWISHRSSYTRTDGTHGVVDDVWFENDQVRTVYRNADQAPTPPAVLLLPELAGYGTLTSLSVAMTNRPALQAQLEGLILQSLTMTPQQVLFAVETFLLDWAGVTGTTPGSRGSYVDARHLVFLEKVHGQGFVAYGGSADPGPKASMQLEAYYDQIIGSMATKLMAQMPVAAIWLTGNPALGNTHPLALLALFDYDRSSDRLIPNLGLLEMELARTLDEPNGFNTLLSAIALFLHVRVDAVLLGGATLADWTLATLAENGASPGVLEALAMAVAADDVILGTSGADTINRAGPTASNDFIAGGAGNDIINGGDGNDTYYWARGDGNDTITENTNGGSADKLVLEGVVASQTTLVRSGLDLTIVVAESAPGAGDGGTILLKATLDEYYSQGVESIVFSDGVTWTRADLRAKVLASVSTSGNDTVTGFNTADGIRAGAGNDVLNGADGNDTYYWARGDGNDTITEATNAGSADKLVLENVLASQVSLARTGNNVSLVVTESAPGAGDGGSILLKENLDEYYSQGVESIVFSDGVTWTRADLRVHVLAAASTAGNDTVTGFNTADNIRAGAGNDTINGADGNDTYYWARGDGNDTITEGTNAGSADKLILEGVLASQISLARTGNDVTLVITESTPGAGDGGTILLKDTLDDYASRGIEQIQFSDAVWSQAELRAKVLQGASTSGNDTVTGFNTADSIRAGEGNDVLNGSGGNDTYYWARGDGNDTITEGTNAGSADKLVLEGVLASQVSLARSGNDVTLVITESAPGTEDGGTILLKATLDEYYSQGVESIVFSDGITWTRADLRTKVLQGSGTPGDDTITGTNVSEALNAGAGNDTINAADGNDLITGGTGNDIINGGGGNDTYYWARGDGNDTITEATFAGSADKLILEGVLASQISLTRTGNDVTLVITESTPGAGDGGTILLKATLDEYYSQGVENIVFNDGITWTRTDLRTRVLTAASTAGNDTVTGFNTADVIRAGAGNDVLNGADGNDTYYWARGDGNDTITEATFAGSADKLVLEGILASQVSLTRTGNDVTLVITESTPGAGDGGTILLKATLDEYYSQGVENIVFNDGMTWTRADLRVHVLAAASTAGNDTVTGFNTADNIRAGAGNDTINGADGNDTYYWARGDGNDTITEATFAGSADKLVLEGILASQITLVRSGLDLTIVVAESTPGAGDGGTILLKDTLDDYASRGIEQIQFNDALWSQAELRAKVLQGASTSGNDTVTGFNTADNIRAGAGNDTINGADGNDTYYWARGDGNDTITESMYAGTTDKLVLEGILASQVSLTRSGNDVTLIIAESAPGAEDGGTVLLKDNMGAYYQQGIEEVLFAAGPSWTSAFMKNALLATATAGNDVLYGTVGNDSISALAGNDRIAAASGDDTLEGGPGDDWLTGGSGSDTFVFRAGSGHDDVTDFEVHDGSLVGDVIHLYDQGTNGFAELMATATELGDDSYLSTSDGGIIALHGVHLADLSPDDFRFA